MSNHDILALFHHAADATPDALALSTPDGPLTYRQLRARADRTTRYLRSRGAQPGNIVGCLFGGAEEYVAALLGIWQAGCVYFPLSMAMPRGRVARLLAQVEPHFLLLDEAGADLIGQMGVDRAFPCIVATRGPAPVHWAAPASWTVDLAPSEDEEGDATPHRWDPEGFCYLYFTSGSTGAPKGVCGRYRAVGHFVEWEIKEFGFASGVRGSQWIDPAFDAFLRDVLVPLCSGGSVHIPLPDLRSDPARCQRWLAEERINLIHCVPTVFRLVTEQRHLEAGLPDLRYILLAGEEVFPADIKRAIDVLGERVQLVNLYGPTETTMVKFCYRTKPTDVLRRTIPVGKPIEGTRAIILNDAGKPCPPGVEGEIYIRTPYRALGYFQDAAETATRFVANPLGTNPADIVYRTGDMGKVLTDGNFQFVGRRDQQIKLHGVRLELGDVEANLHTFPGITQAAVVTTAGNRELCAFYVAGTALETEALQAHLRPHLPEFAVPGHFLRLDALPRLANGKTDYRALRELAPREGESADGDMGPQDDFEQAIATIWREVLGVSSVGRRDRFFQKGGHSLKAMQLVSRIKRTYGVELKLATVFARSSFGELCAEVRALRHAAADVAAAP